METSEKVEAGEGGSDGCASNPIAQVTKAPSLISPYQRGIFAALRQGEYEGWKPSGKDYCPPNPYPERTKDADDWQDGFGRGTELLYPPYTTM